MLFYINILHIYIKNVNVNQWFSTAVLDLAYQGTFGNFRNILIKMWGGGWYYIIQWVEARYAAKNPIMHRSASHNKPLSEPKHQ